MEKRRLGQTDLTISRLGLGCGNFGGIGSAPAFFGQGETQEQAVELLELALELGINWLDTADAYGGGRSETWIGDWLAQRGEEVRSGLVLSTKVFHPVGPDRSDRGLSRARIHRQIDSSLDRLEVEHVDMYLIHEPDPDTPLEETLIALDELVGAGKVRAVGASNIEGWCLQEALEISRTRGLARFEWVQNSYNLLDRDAEDEVLPLCREHGLGFTPFSPLAGGWLTGKYRAGETFPAGSRMTLRPEPYDHLMNEQTFEAVERFLATARESDVQPASLATAWVLSHPAVTGTVVGPRRPEHLRAAADAVSIDLDADERDRLAALFAR